MAERLIYLPLGGAGEIGMNAYVYGYGQPGRERLILIDLGVTFGDMDSAPGIDLIMPDVRWLEDNRDRLEAIFITHGHEDHVGALGLLYGRLKVPVIAGIGSREPILERARQHANDLPVVSFNHEAFGELTLSLLERMDER